MKLNAVFIGINNYSDSQIRNLRFAAHDAQEIHRMVNSSILKDEIKTWLLVNEDASREKIEHTIADGLPSETSSDDVVFLYFSGHGSPETTPDIDSLAR